MALEIYRAKEIPSPDGDYALRRAIHAESDAWVEYVRALRALNCLILKESGSHQGRLNR